MFLKAEDETIQNEILQEVAEKKAADDEKQRAEKEAKAAENMSTMQTANATIPQKQRRKKSKDIDSMFSKEYHAEKLAREPILTYQEVERQFGIRIAGFGRGINPTENSVVLISSIGKKDLNSMSFSNYTIYCTMRFCETQYVAFSYHPVQRSKAVSEAVKGILKGRMFLPVTHMHVRSC